MSIALITVIAICVLARLSTINSTLSKRISRLEIEVQRLHATRVAEQPAATQPEVVPAKPSPEPAGVPPTVEMILEAVQPVRQEAPKQKPPRKQVSPGLLFAPPPLYIKAPPVAPPVPVKPPKSTWATQWQNFKATVDWELFAGARLFAWLGGLALFIAAGFFVKYSIDNDLIPAQVRLAIGAITGVSLLIGSGRITSKQYDILRQTTASGGIGVLYSVAFAATLYYQYIPKSLGFALLCLISATAFVLSAFYKRASIAVLGAIGAFVTPLLVSSGQGTLIHLFLYLAVVSIGLQRVSRVLQSPFLILVAAAGTLFASGCATLSTFGTASPLAMALIWGAIPVLFALFLVPQDLDPEGDQAIKWAGFLTFLPPLAMALVMAVDHSGWHALLIPTCASAAALALTLKNPAWHPRAVPYSALTFLPVFAWAAIRSHAPTSSMSCILFLIYGVTGGLGPVTLIKRNGFTPHMLRWLKIFPLAVVASSLLALLGSPFQNILFWPMLLILQLLGMGVSLIAGAFLQVILLMLIFIGGGLFWLFSVPSVAIGFGFFLFLLVAGGGLTLAMVAITRRSKLTPRLNLPKVPETDFNLPNMEQWLTAAPSVGVFLLIGGAFAIPYPHAPHAGMVTLIAFLGIALFFCKRMAFQPVGVIAIMAAAVAQSVWMVTPGDSTHLFSTMVWSSVLFTGAIALPFLFFKKAHKWYQIWNSMALFEVAEMLFLIYAVKRLWPGDLSGWIPLAPAILKLLPVAKLLKMNTETPHRNSILAFHGGALLFYLSTLPVLLLPHGWIGVALVCEASLLLWLNRRIPHPGLRWVALAMAPCGLAVLFTALPGMKGPDSYPFFNPAIFSVAACTVALGAAVKLSAWPRRTLDRHDLPNLFLWMSLTTGFYLLNLIIADLFAGPGESFNPVPNGDFIHWATYALAWTGFGAVTWRIPRLHIAMRAAGLFVFLSGSITLLLLPVCLPEAMATMSPWINPAIFIYLALMGISGFTFKKEPMEAFGGHSRNLLLASLLLAGFMFLSLASCTTLANGLNFNPLFSLTPSHAVASAAIWVLYGAALLLWPKRLDRPFRITGLVFILAGLTKGLLLPLRFSEAFGAMMPVVNIPTLLYVALLALFTFLTIKSWPTPWPLDQKIDPKPFWGVTLALTAFAVLNIEIASIFATEGQNFSFATHGNLPKQLAYSLSWMIFSIGLLAVGVRWKAPKVRWAAIVLLGLTSLKIFTQDLWSLGQLYRVGSFVGLAFVMILVSIIYQKFLSDDGGEKKPSSTHEEKRGDQTEHENKL